VKKDSSKGYPRPLGKPGAERPEGNQALMLIYLRPMNGPKSKPGRTKTDRMATGRGGKRC
jgi:hypothetical protein